MRRLTLFLTLLIFGSFLFGASCKDSATKVKPDDKPKPDIVKHCAVLLNQTSDPCVEECAKNPAREWCDQTVAKAKFTCPTDGSFKAVNPFTGEDVTLPSPATIEITGEPILSAIPFKDADFQTTIASKGGMLFLDINNNKPSAEVDSIITDIAGASLQGQNYIFAGTLKNLQVIQFSKDSPDASNLPAISQLGGIKQVLVAPSVDISLADNTKSVPSDLLLSVNAPEEGPTKAVVAVDVNYLNMVTAAGDVWRIKLADLLTHGGGCLEQIYSADKNLVDQKRMVAEKIAVASQYVAIITQTEKDALDNIDGVSKAEWKNSFKAGIPDDLILDKFYRFAQHLDDPQNSKQVVKILNLWTSKYGYTADVNTQPEPSGRYYANDLALKGSQLFLTAYMYDIASGLVTTGGKTLLEGLTTIWNAARKGEAIPADADNAITGFVTSAKAGVLIIDAIKSTISSNVTLTNKSEPSPIFTTIAKGSDKFFIRGENRYLATAGFDNPAVITASKIESGSLLTPWRTLYDETTKSLLTTFISELEVYDISNTTAKLIK